MDRHPDSGEGRIWLERGIRAAKAGQRAEARQALFRALNSDALRETTFLWLASVADDRRQERVYLEKVLSINPENTYARAGIARLDGQGATGSTPAGLTEVVPPLSTAPGSDPSAAEKNAFLHVPRPAAPPHIPRNDPAEDTQAGGEASGERSAARAPAQSSVDAEEPADAEAVLHSSTQEIPVVKAVLDEAEPTGWTTGTRPVKRAPAPQPQPGEVSGWTRASAPVSPAHTSLPRVGERLDGDEPDERSARGGPRERSFSSPRVGERPGQRPGHASLRTRSGGAGVMVREIFDSHEMWTLVMGGLSLLALMALLAALTVASLLAA